MQSHDRRPEVHETTVRGHGWPHFADTGLDSDVGRVPGCRFWLCSTSSDVACKDDSLGTTGF